MTLTIILFVILIFLSAFFSGIEIAFFSLSKARVHTMVRRKVNGAELVQKLKSNSQRLLVTILIGNNLVNIFAASVATQVALDVFGSAGIGIATGIVTLLVLVFGEIFPKAIARVHAPKITTMTAPLVYSLQLLLFPLVIIFEKLSVVAVKIVPKTHEHIGLEEDVHSMMHMGVQEGEVERHEKEFVERLFKFNDIPIASVITKLEDMVMIEDDAVIDQIAHFVANSGYSRFPVHEGGKQNVIGYVHIKDLFRAVKSDNRDMTVRSIMQPVQSITDDEIIDDVFRTMVRQRVHYMLVRSSNGVIIGSVTIEDILEELLGEMYDESDKIKTSVIS